MGWVVLVTVGVSLVPAGCTEEPAPAWRGPGTVQMDERLQRLAAEVEPMNHPYVRSARLELALGIEPPTDLTRRLTLETNIAREALRVGQTEEAIARLERLAAEIPSYPGQVSKQLVVAIVESLGTAYLRLWERENCVEPQGILPCLFPIETGGSSSVSGTARSAVSAHQGLLQVDPENMTARFLLNLSYMMLGEYPQGVPERYLIPPEALESEYDVGRFRDVTPGLGLDVMGHLGGSIMDDFDSDDDLDIVISSWHLGDQLRLFLNEGDGTFRDATLEAGLEGVVGGIHMEHADYNNDGWLDILILRGAWTPHGEPNSLLRNNGDGTFEDVTEVAGLLATYPTQSASWGDYDNDGWLDLYVGIDLYMSRLLEPNVLLRNDGPDAEGRWRFTDVTATAGVAEPIASFPTWFWDYDNDGWLDIFVSDYSGTPGDLAAEYLGLPHRAELPRLYRNSGDGTFADAMERVRLDRIMITMGSNYGDLDNDGWEDFYLATGEANLQTIIPNRMFRNAGGEVFQDVTTSGGFGHLGKGHGVAFGDLDNDGDQDIYATMGGAYEADLARNVLFENPGHGNRWITLRLEGVQSNRSAIGARLRVVVRTDSGQREIHRMVSSGGTFGTNSLQQEIGLGQALAIQAVEVTWPATGETDTFTDVELDRVYRLREGDGSLTPVTVTRFRLSGASEGTRP